MEEDFPIKTHADCCDWRAFKDISMTCCLWWKGKLMTETTRGSEFPSDFSLLMSRFLARGAPLNSVLRLFAESRASINFTALLMGLDGRPFRCLNPPDNEIQLLGREPDTYRLLTDPNIPFGRVGDDVDIEIVARQVAPQVELFVGRECALRQQEEIVKVTVQPVIPSVTGEMLRELELAVCLQWDHNCRNYWINFYHLRLSFGDSTAHRTLLLHRHERN